MDDDHVQLIDYSTNLNGPINRYDTNRNKNADRTQLPEWDCLSSASRIPPASSNIPPACSNTPAPSAISSTLQAASHSGIVRGHPRGTQL
jgi:hypothetical protein